MCALLSMAVYDSIENQRTPMTEETLISLGNTVNFAKHSLYVIDNASCKETKDLLKKYQAMMGFTLITNEENVGTAKAVNMGWANRRPGENCIKLDNDVVIHQKGWVDLMEEAISREPHIGIIAIKRKDLVENPNLPEDHWAHSKLWMLPHKPGDKWIIIEQVHHVMGTCQMMSGDLIDKAGGFFQMEGLYGFDDSLYSVRSQVLNFMNVFLHGIEIDHIDNGAAFEYLDWKQKYSGEMMAEYNRVKAGYYDGSINTYHPL